MYKSQGFFKEKNEQTGRNFIRIEFVLMHVRFLSECERGMIEA